MFHNLINKLVYYNFISIGKVINYSCCKVKYHLQAVDDIFMF